MKYKKTLLFLAVTTVAAFYLVWPGFTPKLPPAPNLHILHTESYGKNSGYGNVVGIEPYMEQLDYATPASFKAKLDGYFSEAVKNGWFADETIVLLPEHIGTWLAYSNSGSRVYEANSASAAALPIVFSNLFQYLKNIFIFDEKDNISAAFIRTQTQKTAAIINDIFGELASKYNVTIVAGSTALMTPGVYPNRLSYGHGPIFNTSFVFGPDGKAQNDAIRKVFPILSEAGFTQASSAEYLPTFKTNHHKFGVMICADSWFNGPSSYLKKEGVDLLLVPSFLSNADWNSPWHGYTAGTHSKNAAWKQDVNQITEGEAWIKYALPAQMKKHDIKWGMNVFLKGRLWGEHGDGHALIIENGTLHIGKTGSEGAAIYNLWLAE